MLYIYHGPDDYTKRLHLSRLSQGLAVPVEQFDEEQVPEASRLLGGDLFGGITIFFLKNILQNVLTEDLLEPFAKSPNHIVFIQDSLDKRLSLTKKLLQYKNAQVQEYIVPEGAELIAWIVNRAAEVGATLDRDTARFLLERLGVAQGAAGTKKGFGAESRISLLQINSELEKLAAYAGGNVVTTAMVEDLTPSFGEVTGFEITNALADRNKQKVFTLCNRFFSESPGLDEKTKMLQLNSLLADQFRSLLIVQDFAKERVPEQELLAQTGWKPGRLFVMKKIATRFDRKTVLETLGRLESLDIELKNTTTPAHVLIDLIFAQLM